MKRISIMALVMLMAGSAMALEFEPKPGFSLQIFAGYNVTNMSGMYVNNQNVDNPKVGVNAGFKLDYMLPNAKGTYFNVGIDWTQKGAIRTYNTNAIDVNGNPVATDVTNKMQAHYLELPVHVGFRYNISQKWGVYAEVGPYFAVGVTGKNRMKFVDDTVDDTNEMYFGKHFDRLYGYNTTAVPAVVVQDMRAIQRFDCGMGFRIGGEFNHQYSLNIAYDWGITDAYTDDYRKAVALVPGATPLAKLKNRNFTMTFGFRF